MKWLRWIFRRHAPATPGTLGRPLGTTVIEDRSIGCLLGTACGDILGANVEQVSRKEIQQWHGRVADFFGSTARPMGRYTDDTEMTLALASSLVAMGRFDAAHCANSYACFFARPPLRGYGSTTKKVLQALLNGADYRFTGKMLIPSSSYGNGGAMRIAPVGVAFRYAEDTVLHRAVELALLSTHTHPEAVDGAWLQSKIVGWLVKIQPAQFNTNVFLAWLKTIARTETMREKVAKIERGLREKWDSDRFLSESCALDGVRGRIFQIHAAEAMACAVWSFVRHYKEPEECIIRAVGLGGDSDTIGAIAGAQVGALHGTTWIPRRWYDNIENHPETGRDVIVAIARQLALLDLREIKEEPWPANKSAYIRKPETPDSN